MFKPIRSLDLHDLLGHLQGADVVVEHVFLDSDTHLPLEGLERHRAAALAGIAEIARRRDNRPYFEVRWDETRLVGGPVDVAAFWETADGSEPPEATSLDFEEPSIAVYRAAFFDPPYPLRGDAGDPARLYEQALREAFGAEPHRAELVAWSTDWSNYFDAGHEWWGAFYWTIRPAGSTRMTVIAASATD